MAHTNDMIDIAEGELEQFVGQDTGSVGEAKQAVISENGA